jgi:ABC-type Co2+ transport system permease subunit
MVSFKVNMCGVEYMEGQSINLMGYPHVHQVGMMLLICIRGLSIGEGLLTQLIVTMTKNNAPT